MVRAYGDIQPDTIVDINFEMLVHEIMTTHFVTINLQDDVLSIANKMIKHKVDSVIVKDSDNVVGIITEADIISKVVVKNILPSTVLAKSVMSSPIIAISPSTDVIEAALIMNKNNIRRLVVLDENKIVGLLNDRNIIAVSSGLNTILKNLIDLHKDETDFKEEETTFESSICQRCGAFTDLSLINGLILCEDCKEEEGFYD